MITVKRILALKRTRRSKKEAKLRVKFLKDTNTMLWIGVKDLYKIVNKRKFDEERNKIDIKFLKDQKWNAIQRIFIDFKKK